jgi:hypothetical protein
MRALNFDFVLTVSVYLKFDSVLLSVVQSKEINFDNLNRFNSLVFVEDKVVSCEVGTHI